MFPASSDSDESLVSQAVSGDAGSFEILVERYKEKAVRIAFSYTRNFDDAKDVAQEAFVKTFRSLNRFGGHSKFYTWFFRIVVNQSIDFIRKRKEVPSSGSTIFESIPDISGEASDSPRAEETRSLLMRSVEALAPQQRTVIVLTYFHDMSTHEVAEVMNVSEGTVKATRFQALEKLRTALQTVKEIPHERA